MSERDQAILDCIKAIMKVEGIYLNLYSPNPPLRKWVDEMDAIAALRNLQSAFAGVRGVNLGEN